MFLYPMDPQEMAYKYDTDKKLVGFDQADEKEVADRLEIIRDALAALPQRERDMLEMHFFRRKGQAEIGRLFKVTQGDVSYRISRSIERIQFYISLPKVCLRRMARDLMQIFQDPLYVKIMILMFKTTSQTAVGKEVGLSQGKVRYRFIKCLEAIKEVSEEKPIYGLYAFIFQKVNDNFNIMRSLDTQERWADKFE